MINNKLLKTLSFTFSLLILLSSCKVYRPQVVNYKDIDYKDKEVYLRFSDNPELIYQLTDYKVENNKFYADINSNFGKIKSKKAVEIWKKEVGNLNKDKQQKIVFDLSDIDKIEEYKVSKKATTIQAVGITVGLAVVGFVVYLISRNQ
jgi:hypothetical protein